MPDLATTLKLLDRLVQLTKLGKLDWEETANESEFIAVLSGHSVSVRKKFTGVNWGEKEYEHSLIVRDAEARLLDEATEFDIPEGQTIGRTNARVALRELYEAARRKAMNIEASLSDLIATLDSIK